MGGGAIVVVIVAVGRSGRVVGGAVPSHDELWIAVVNYDQNEFEQYFSKCCRSSCDPEVMSCAL